VCAQFDVHRLVRFIEDWSYESEKHGEYGWSLTTLSGTFPGLANARLLHLVLPAILLTLPTCRLIYIYVCYTAASQHIAAFSPEASEESESGKDQQNGWPS
jgi:hypothetical protein